MLQFGRDYEVQFSLERVSAKTGFKGGSTRPIGVNDLVIRNLDIEFVVVKTLTPEPNTCDLKIYDLNGDHISQLTKIENPIVQLKAGYTDPVDEFELEPDSNMGVIFLGDVSEVSSTYVGPNWVTKFSSGDGLRSRMFDRMSKSFNKQVKLEDVFKSFGKAMVVGAGNFYEKIKEGKLLEAGDELINGAVLSGPTQSQVERFMKSASLEWSIQDDKFQVLNIGGLVDETAVLLQKDTGLIGSPTVSSEPLKKREGEPRRSLSVVHVRALMNPQIFPGRQIVIKSKVFPDTIRIRAERCVYRGKSDKGDWYVDTEGTIL